MTPKFANGTKVTVILGLETGLRYYEGKIGTVLQTSEKSSKPTLVEVGFSDGETTPDWFYESELLECTNN